MHKLLVFGLMLVVTGCGKSGPKTYEVTGTVTYDGQPLDAGSIAFTPADTKMRGGQVTITAGKYSIQLPAGEMAVKIYAERPSGPYDETMGGTPSEQYLHANYNDNTKLKATIDTESGQVHDFKLTKDGKVNP